MTYSMVASWVASLLWNRPWNRLHNFLSLDTQDVKRGKLRCARNFTRNPLRFLTGPICSCDRVENHLSEPDRNHANAPIRIGRRWKHMAGANLEPNLGHLIQTKVYCMPSMSPVLRSHPHPIKTVSFLPLGMWDWIVYPVSVTLVCITGNKSAPAALRDHGDGDDESLIAFPNDRYASIRPSDRKKRYKWVLPGPSQCSKWVYPGSSHYCEWGIPGSSLCCR